MDRFGSSGARGPVESDIRPSTVLEIAQAAVSHWQTDRVVIGRDVRVTGESLETAAISGATAAGATVVEVGVVPTPAIQFYADQHDIPGIVITASHNPPPDNGVKLVAPDGGEVSVPTYEAVESKLSPDALELAPWDQFGSVTRVDDLADRYIADVRDAVDTSKIAEAGLKIVVDAGNGTGGYTSPTLCRYLGCEVVTLNAQPDGHFPGRQSEPVPDALADLSKLVSETGSDLGVAHDGDADRAVFVDETGTIIEGGATLCALAAAVSDPGDTIVAAITAPRSLSRVAKQSEANLEMTRVGAAHLLTTVRELQQAGERVSIAGEQNGGLIFPSYRLARDGAYALGKILELVAEKPLSEVVAPFVDRAYRRRDIPLESRGSVDNMLEAVKHWGTQQDGSITAVDGVRVDLEDEWVLIRPSGTEPLVRIYAEAATEDRAVELLDSVASMIGEETE